MSIPSYIPKYARKRIEHWDDERGQGNSLIVTLHYGWSFEPNAHEGVQGFDTVREAIDAVRTAHNCRCDECQIW